MLEFERGTHPVFHAVINAWRDFLDMQNVPITVHHQNAILVAPAPGFNFGQLFRALNPIHCG